MYYIFCMTGIVIMHGGVVRQLYIDPNAPSSICEQGFNAGGNFGVSVDQILGPRGENGQYDGVFSTKSDVLVKIFKVKYI